MLLTPAFAEVSEGLGDFLRNDQGRQKKKGLKKNHFFINTSGYVCQLKMNGVKEILGES